MYSLKYFKQLILRFSVLLIISTSIRILYYLYNSQYFPAPSFGEWVLIIIGGLRFDTESLIYINALFIILSLLPFPLRNNKIYNNILKGIFIVTNLIFITVELGDMLYFQYVFRRINGSDMSILFNSFEVIPSLVSQHSIGILFFIILGSMVWYIFKKTEIKVLEKINYIWAVILFLLGIGLSIIGSRGGLQLRPLSPISAARYVKKKEHTPLVSNGTIHLLFATEQSYLKKKNYFSNKQAYKIFNPLIKMDGNKEMQKKNIFIITLESFGKEYINYFNKDLTKKFTPFLDSLIKESFLFDNGYACGTRSPYGIAGIGGSIPTLMEQPLSFSAYQTNCIDGMGSLLNEVGYTTGFFHGARPSSMNIDRLGKLEGFTKIFTKKEFNDDSKFDGSWGIWDDHFFQYTIQEVSKFKEPFSAFLFSMTSHPPYHTEKYFEEMYPDEEPIMRSVHYVDYSLRRLFNEAKKQSWYKNTIFVITADHIGKAFDKNYSNYYSRYQIPILFYTPDSTWQGKHSGVFMQTDIMPTLLNSLGYPNDFNGFGVDAFDKKKPHYAYTYSNGVYQILDNEFILFFDGNKSKGLYNYKKDPKMTIDISDNQNEKKEELESYLKALIQIHNELMIDNKICNYNFNKNK